MGQIAGSAIGLRVAEGTTVWTSATVAPPIDRIFDRIEQSEHQRYFSLKREGKSPRRALAMSSELKLPPWFTPKRRWRYRLCCRKGQRKRAPNCRRMPLARGGACRRISSNPHIERSEVRFDPVKPYSWARVT